MIDMTCGERKTGATEVVSIESDVPDWRVSVLNAGIHLPHTESWRNRFPAGCLTVGVFARLEGL